MKKTFIVFGIFIALVVFFAISCSAAVLRDIQYPFIRVPAESNFAQPVYTRSNAISGSGIISWGQSYVPSTVSRSAFNSVCSYYTPDNNEYATGSYLLSWNHDSVSPIYYLFQYTSQLFGSSQGPAVGAYLHIIIDFGGSSGIFSTSPAVLENLYFLVGTGDSQYMLPVSFLATRPVGFVDIPITTNTALPDLALIYKRPDSTSTSTVSAYTLCINNIWAFNDNHETYTITDDIVLTPCGYTTCYMQYNNYLESLSFDSVDTSYWYNLGFAQAKDSAYSSGYTDGYGAGVQSVTDEVGDPVSIRTLIFAVPDAIVGLLRSLFDWQFAGFNLYLAFKFLLALLAVCFVVRLVMRSMV